MFQGNKTIFSWMTIFTLIVFWFISSHAIGQPNLLFPTPEETVSSLINLFFYHGLAIDLVATFLRTFTAFIFALCLGSLCGVIIGSSKFLVTSTHFLFDFFRALPSVVLFPLFLLIFGINDKARVGLAFFVGFWIISLTIIHSMQHMSYSRLDIANIFHAKKIHKLRDILFWEILPSIFISAKLAFPIMLIIIITAEMLAAPTRGIGVQLIDLQSRYKIPEMYGVIIVIGVLGYSISRLLSIAERKLVRWKL